MCGIFGIAKHAEAVNMTYLGLHMLQHRGQESTGISSSDGAAVFTYKANGYVADVFTEEILSRLRGSNAIGHTRYSTAGGGGECNAQPIVAVMAGIIVSLVHNGNLINADGLRSVLERDGAVFQSTSDSEVIVHLLARAQTHDIMERLIWALGQVQGAFSLIILTRDSVIGVRDPNGFRPLNLGRIDGSYVFASETCAFDLIGAEYIREVEPGEIIMICGTEMKSVKLPPARRLAKCIFEHVYFSRPDSIVFGRSVHERRNRMGSILARESPVDADLVVPVPDSGIAAAEGFSEESGIRLKHALTRNHYGKRSFIEPRSSIRDFGLKVKLNPVRALLVGKSVVLIDDSIVRGSTSRKLIRRIKAAGAIEVHMRISCPPTMWPCFMGVDTPTRKELIASSHTIEEICRSIEADSLAYLSLRGLLEAMEADNEFCTACYTGEYPLDVSHLLAGQI